MHASHRSPRPHPAERIGPAFSVDGMLLARQQTRLAIERIAARITPGMVEETPWPWPAS
jgi:hypothetical protein